MQTILIMAKLANYFDRLPKELQLLIYEFNADHRSKMRKVLAVFKIYKPYRLTCENCNITKIGHVLYSYSYEEFICSEKCCHEIQRLQNKK